MKKFKARYIDIPTHVKVKNSLFSSKPVGQRQIDTPYLCTNIERGYSQFDEDGYDVVDVIVLGTGSLILVGKLRAS